MLSDVLDQAVLLNRQNPTDDDGRISSNTSTTNANIRRPDHRVMASNDAAAACPVDHKSREAWMEQARQAAAASSSSSSSQPSLPAFHPPVPPPAANGAAQETCPVDHKARDVWVQQARAAAAAPDPATPAPTSPAVKAATAAASSSSSWTSSVLSYLPFGSSSSAAANAAAAPKPQPGGLSTSREISTIPRTEMLAAMADSTNTTHALPLPPPPPQAPANNEQETGADAASGNWIYPSERMFFDAMKRKGHDPRSSDMQTIVPIHNAVNERAWADIKRWEEPFTQGTSCDGPRLSSFSGLSSQMSPKARINTWLGYHAPFDRHDWVVDRCGTEIEYVIDFYAGRPTGDGKPSFFLDVRPKLNSWEGIKMRAMKGMGLI